MNQAYIHIKGCSQNNLKNISLKLQKNKIILITGVSGSGKSSLAFDAIYAESLRRYLEYLSPQARTWIKQLPKPKVDLIEGVLPVLAVSQQKGSPSPRGMIAEYTDIYDFLSILFSKIGIQHSPSTGLPLARHTRQEIVEILLKEYPPGSRLQIISPIRVEKETAAEAIQRLQQMGFIRIRINETEIDPENTSFSFTKSDKLEVVVDRIEMREGVRQRLGSSVETALDLGRGIIKIIEGKEGKKKLLTEIYVCPDTGVSFPPLEPSDFNFHSQKGACPQCKGKGGLFAINAGLIPWDEKIPLFLQVSNWLEYLPKQIAKLALKVWSAFSEKFYESIDLAYKDIPQKLYEEILHGSKEKFPIHLHESESEPQDVIWKGFVPLFQEMLTRQKELPRLKDLPFVEWEKCLACRGSCLKQTALFCKVQGKSIDQICSMTIKSLLEEIQTWTFHGKEKLISLEIIPQITDRLNLLNEVGLGYLELNRLGKTLSDGEAQRMQLAAQMGSKLSGILYVLDEPSLGLHRQDVLHLIHVIKQLKELGNSLILVEHDRALIKEADDIVEIGPGAGVQGGQIVFQGDYPSLLNSSAETGAWLSGKKQFPKPLCRKIQSRQMLKAANITCHNLHDFTVDIPLGVLVGFCGVSGSGKSTLVEDVIATQLKQWFAKKIKPANLLQYQEIERLVVVDRTGINFSPHSIPATYIDLMTHLRQLFAETKLAKARGYTPARFSLHKKGGRCDACEGLGQVRVSLEFMPDIYTPCDICQGNRYNYETLQIFWEHYNIADILNMSITQAYDIFKNIPPLASKLKLMIELGLEYLTLGQSFTTLSGGEVQRLRLVADLAGSHNAKTLYILDEPSAGLHFQDIEKLIFILQRLVDNGHSVWMIEHQLDLLRQADWLIELGRGGGPHGGKIIFEGPLEKMKSADTPTGQVI